MRGLTPPEGVEARHDIWQFLEIVRRMYPERAARVGYVEEIRDREGWVILGLSKSLWMGLGLSLLPKKMHRNR